MVEMALVFPIILTLIMGIVSLSQVIVGKIIAAQAVQDAAQALTRGGNACALRSQTAYYRTVHPAEGLLADYEITIKKTPTATPSLIIESKVNSSCALCGTVARLTGFRPGLNASRTVTLEPAGAAECLALIP